MDSNKLANIFIKQREIIEAAETPFAKLAVFILPIIAPIVPAVMTGVHLYSLFITIFLFDPSNTVSKLLSSIIALVLELLGYVGAISAIKSLFVWIKERTSQHLVPLTLNGVAYTFYLLAMVLINFYLGKYLGEKPLVTGIVGLLSLITVPTGLLAANHLNESAEQEKSNRTAKEERDYADQLRREQLAHDDLVRRELENGKMERYRIKHGVESSRKVPENLESSLESSNENGKFQQVSKKVPDWRKTSKELSNEQKLEMAKWTPDQMRQYASETNMTYKTISNYRLRARQELGLKDD